MKEKRAFVSTRKPKLSDPKSDLKTLIEDLRARRQFVVTFVPLPPSHLGIVKQACSALGLSSVVAANCFLLLTLFANQPSLRSEI